MQQKTGLTELALLVGTAAILWPTMGWLVAVAVAYGGVVVVANGWLQRWQQGRAAEIAGNDPARNLRYLYRCAAERFIATVILFAAGLGLMALPPLPLLGGYVIAQGAVIYRFYQVSSLRRRHG